MLTAFMGEDGDLDDKKFGKELTKANREVKTAAAGSGVKIRDITSGVVPEHEVECNAYHRANSAYVKHATVGWVGRLIRRGNDSVQADGATGVIAGVPPLTVTDAWVVIPPEELERIDAAGGCMDEE